YIDAEQSLAIQINQNKSDIKMAEQKAKFAVMDLEKYIGDVASKQILAAIGLPYDVFTNERSEAEQTLLDSVNNPNLATSQTVPELAEHGEAGSPVPAPSAGTIGSTNEWLNTTRSNSQLAQSHSPTAPKPRLDSL